MNDKTAAIKKVIERELLILIGVIILLKILVSLPLNTHFVLTWVFISYPAYIIVRLITWAIRLFSSRNQ